MPPQHTFARGNENEKLPHRKKTTGEAKSSDAAGSAFASSDGTREPINPSSPKRQTGRAHHRRRFGPQPVSRYQPITSHQRPPGGRKGPPARPSGGEGLSPPRAPACPPQERRRRQRGHGHRRCRRSGDNAPLAEVHQLLHLRACARACVTVKGSISIAK